MAQRIDYAFFPGVRDESLWPTINKVFGQVRRNQLTLRDFRDWLKDAALWQKEEAPALLEFLDIAQAPTVHLGPWAESVFAAKDDAAARDLLFKRLCDENVLLAKYVLEALDVDGGGRLHSTSELHRMLTSYVYPGKHVGRVAFEAWIKWMVASGRVRLIGIRWGLSDLGKQAVQRLRTVDADEFLEDESAQQTASASAPLPPVAPPLAPPAPPPVKASSAAASPPGDDEEMPDAPPEAEPVDAQTFAAYEARLSETPPVAAVTSPAPRKGHVASAAPQVTKGQPQAPQLAAADSTVGPAPRDTGEILTMLREVGRQRGLGGGALLLAYGIESRMAQNDAARHLFLAALLARLSLQPDRDALVDLLRERAGGWGPVALLLDRPEALVDCLTRWQLTGAEPQAIRLRALLLDATLGGRALKTQPDLPAQLAQAATSDQLLTLLDQGLLHAASWPEQFWLVREMVKAGLWTRQSATEAAFVPTRAVRLMAYRLHLLDSHFAHSLGMFLQIARRLAALLPAGSVEAAALEALAPDDHLRFDCPHVVVCQTSCVVAAGTAQ